MNRWICKKFIKNHEDTKNPEVRENYGKLAGIIGIISNALLCVGKVVVGILSGSIAIIADGVNNLADASSSIITLVGFKMAAMPEDEDHPYGHARIEYISGMIVSVLIVVVGIELGRSSFDKILHPAPIVFSWTLVAVLIASILMKIWQSRFNVLVGKRINSLTLMATGTDSRNDVIATSAVLISVFIGQYTGLLIDGYMGMLVALFIIWSGIGLIRETINPLLGEAPDQEIVDTIFQLAEAHEGVLGIHDLVVHNYGPGKVFASIHIEVDADGDLMQSHDMVDNIEREIASKMNIAITAHLDPTRFNDPVVIKMKEVAEQVAESIEGISNVHDLRVVAGHTHTNIIFDVVMSTECSFSKKEIHQKFDEAAKAIDANYYTVINFDQSYIR
ncbi:cation diffusion facilitator family transporter [Clostridiales Family XIII bacterium PM5-7]